MTRPRRARATTSRRPARRLAINWELVEQRRITAGLTHAQLAERVGVAAVTGPVRLWQDGGHDAVPLGLLERLCQVLDLHPVELFRAPQRAAQRRALAAPEEAADGQVLEAALATLPAPPAAGQHAPAVSRAGLADALGWPLPRLVAAIADLDDTLAGRGVRLDVDVVGDARAVHGVTPRPGLLTPAQREALHRLMYAGEVVLDIDTVRVLYAAADPDIRCSERHQAISADAAVRLQQLGLVRRRDRARDLELTDDADTPCSSTPGTSQHALTFTWRHPLTHPGAVTDISMSLDSPSQERSAPANSTGLSSDRWDHRTTKDAFVGEWAAPGLSWSASSRGDRRHERMSPGCGDGLYGRHRRCYLVPPCHMSDLPRSADEFVAAFAGDPPHTLDTRLRTLAVNRPRAGSWSGERPATPRSMWSDSVAVPR